MEISKKLKVSICYSIKITILIIIIIPENNNKCQWEETCLKSPVFIIITDWIFFIADFCHQSN